MECARAKAVAKSGSSSLHLKKSLGDCSRSRGGSVLLAVLVLLAALVTLILAAQFEVGVAWRAEERRRHMVLTRLAMNDAAWATLQSMSGLGLQTNYVSYFYEPDITVGVTITNKTELNVASSALGQKLWVQAYQGGSLGLRVRRWVYWP